MDAVAVLSGMMGGDWEDDKAVLSWFESAAGEIEAKIAAVRDDGIKAQVTSIIYVYTYICVCKYISEVDRRRARRRNQDADHTHIYPQMSIYVYIYIFLCMYIFIIYIYACMHICACVFGLTLNPLTLERPVRVRPVSLLLP